MCIFLWFLLDFSFSFAVTKFVRIGIADKNDSPPYFDRFLYETEIDENADLQSTVLTVNAKDHNECEYRLNTYIHTYIQTIL